MKLFYFSGNGGDSVDRLAKKNTKTKQKIKESCTTIGSNNLKLTIINTIEDFKRTLTKLRMKMPYNLNFDMM